MCKFVNSPFTRVSAPSCLRPGRTYLPFTAPIPFRTHHKHAVQTFRPSTHRFNKHLDPTFRYNATQEDARCDRARTMVVLMRAERA